MHQSCRELSSQRDVSQAESRPCNPTFRKRKFGFSTVIIGLAPTFGIRVLGFAAYGLASGALAHTADVVLVEAYPETPDLSLFGLVPIPLLFGTVAELITLSTAMFSVFLGAMALLVLIIWRMPDG